MNKLSTPVEKLTREMVLNIPAGGVLTVKLPSFMATQNARHTVTTAGHITGRRFSVSVDSTDNTVQIFEIL